MKISLDTNILINEPQILFDNTREFVISFTVIRELDKLKRNPDLKRVAQQAIKNIWYQFNAEKLEILNIPKTLGESPDETIVSDTKEAGASLLSEDIGARIIAKAYGVHISDFESTSEINLDYLGYQELQGDLTYEQEYSMLKEMQPVEFAEIFKVTMHENEYFVIHRVVEKDDIWKHQTGKVTRISQSMKPYRDAEILIAPLDSIQMCTLDAVFDSSIPLTIIDGTLGTGKTLLTLMAALAKTTGDLRVRDYDKILVTKPPISVNKALYTGYKPGSSSEKLAGHLGGVKSNLRFLLDRRTPRQAKRHEDPAILRSDEIWDEYFGVIELDEIQGTSLHNTLLIVDEWQLLNTDDVKLLISRIAEGSKLVLIGDTEGQTYGVNRSNEGFKIIYKYLGKAHEFSYIKLQNIYRSRLAAFVDRIFKDV